jgi:hypothetical protein
VVLGDAESIVREVNKRLLEEHHRREELEERFVALKEKYDRMRESKEWADIDSGR